jgi:XTP/dITP diphosphohydrolase
MVELVLATRNEHKIRELKSLLSDLPLALLSLKDLPGFPEVSEDGDNYQDNAVRKAVEIARWSGRMALADDSGLEVDYLGGAPGVRSARFAGEGATSAAKNALILKLLKDLPIEKRTARFCCVVAVATPRGDVEIASGVCHGYISSRPRGEEGFGYDPIFVVPAYQMTLAELRPEVKNRLSHRALAVGKAKDVLRRYVSS